MTICSDMTMLMKILLLNSDCNFFIELKSLLIFLQRRYFLTIFWLIANHKMVTFDVENPAQNERHKYGWYTDQKDLGSILCKILLINLIRCTDMMRQNFSLRALV